MTIKELAAEMNVTEADVLGFVAALSVWISKGCTFEQAIEKNLSQMKRLASNAVELSTVMKPDAIEWFYG